MNVSARCRLVVTMPMVMVVVIVMVVFVATMVSGPERARARCRVSASLAVPTASVWPVCRLISLAWELSEQPQVSHIGHLVFFDSEFFAGEPFEIAAATLAAAEWLFERYLASAGTAAGEAGNFDDLELRHRRRWFPRCTASKQNRIASGRMADSLPISSTTRVTLLWACSATIATTSCAIPSSCIGRTFRSTLLRTYFPIEPTAKIEPTSNMTTVKTAITAPARVSRIFMRVLLSKQDAIVGFISPRWRDRKDGRHRINDSTSTTALSTAACTGSLRPGRHVPFKIGADIRGLAADHEHAAGDHLPWSSPCCRTLTGSREWGSSNAGPSAELSCSLISGSMI